MLTEIRTHQRANPRLCGVVVRVEPGLSQVRMTVTEEMIVDDFLLAHGGFIFSLADYAAMLAVNHEHVVLAHAEMEFLRPSRLNDLLVATARLVSSERSKRRVRVSVKKNDELIAEGTFLCVVPGKHVLDRGEQTNSREESS